MGWALVSGVPSRAFVPHGRAVLQGEPRAVHHAGLNIFSRFCMRSGILLRSFLALAASLLPQGQGTESGC